MNAEPDIHNHAANGSAASSTLLKSAVSELRDYANRLRPLRHAIGVIEELGDEAAGRTARKLTRHLAELEPSITMIGQIKSGKTSLVNTMIGWPHLLPADVNPWTSVVTSIHLKPDPQSPARTATFRFFKKDEWDKLIQGGGRIGELAGRAGAEDELAKIKAQVNAMREKSKSRLGRRFEMLLGQEHAYETFDEALIERYVCLGDDFEDELPPQKQGDQGRFADITKSARLTFHQPAIPMKLCIRDTPGVNDTFMMREQVTIQSIRDSRICVVVLSAHQALSSTDMALIRLIANVKTRDVVIFVNRIDELSDPGTQVPQIEASIAATLAKHNGPGGAEIIFGSALWAEYAMSGALEMMPAASKAASENHADARGLALSDFIGEPELIWELSGLPALYHSIGQRILEGVGREVAGRVATDASNLINQIRVSDNVAAKAEVDAARINVRRVDIRKHFELLRDTSLRHLVGDLDAAESAFEARIERAHQSFLSRATSALITHLNTHGDKVVWEYEPTGLRVLLGTAYKSFGQKCQTAFSKGTRHFIRDAAGLYRDALELPEELFDIKAPAAPRIPPPVSIGQTIALDLKGGWWRSWWQRRRGYDAFAKDFQDLIQSETSDLISDLRQQQAADIRQDTISAFEAFLDEQMSVLRSVTEKNALDRDKLNQLFGMETLEQRERELSRALTMLQGFDE